MCNYGVYKSYEHRSTRMHSPFSNGSVHISVEALAGKPATSKVMGFPPLMTGHPSLSHSTGAMNVSLPM